MSFHLKRKDGPPLDLTLRRTPDGWLASHGSDTRPVTVLQHSADRITFVLDGVVHLAHVAVSQREVRVVLDGRESVFVRHEPGAATHGGAASEINEPLLRAPVPGRVLQVRVEVGAAVQSGDVLVVIEAMKMETPVVAPSDGRVVELHVAAGDLVDQDQPLVTCSY